VIRRIVILSCLALLALTPLRAASAQQGQRLNLIRDAEIENTIRTFVTPIWKAAGLHPEAVEIYIVQDNSLNAFVAGGQRIFINSGLLMRTETPNQLIGVLAHETGHIAGGHLARAQEELRNLSTMQILETILSAGAMAGGAASGRMGGPGPTGGGAPASGSMMSMLRYSQTQESSADQAGITFLERTGQSPKGALQFLHILQQQERMNMNTPSPYLRTHPLTQERIAAYEEAVARSPYANTPDSPRFVDMHGRMVAKLYGFISPQAALQHWSEADRSVTARYARAIALFRTGATGSSMFAIEGLIRDYPNDPYFHELRGQVLYESGHPADSVVSYRKAVQLLPGSALMKIDLARSLVETNTPDNDREAIRNLEMAAQTEYDSFDLWRLEASVYARQNNAGMTSLARAEMAVVRGNRSEAQVHAAAAERQLPAGTPAWQRAQDIKALNSSRANR
jgi:predicted Zn-dependent protease